MCFIILFYLYTLTELYKDNTIFIGDQVYRNDVNKCGVSVPNPEK